MSILVEYDSYEDICEHYMYGKHFLELSPQILDNINAYFDGCTIDLASANPDNMWVNLSMLGIEEVLVRRSRLLSEEEFKRIDEQESLEEYVENTLDEILERFDSEIYFLGYENRIFYVFYL